MNHRMLQFLRDSPIRRKLMMIIMLVSSAALLLACSTFLVYERNALRGSMARDFAIIADTFDDNVSSGLTFDDPESVTHTLETLQADPGIVAACVYGESGDIVAEYQRADLKNGFEFPAVQRTGQRFLDDRLDTYQDINLAGEIIGAVYIASDMSAITRRMQHSAVIVVIVMAGALLLAFFLSTWLQRVISEPIAHLARVASIVATEKDYSVRAVKQSGDELGSLIDAFNDMLMQIQLQDSALQTARESLEKRVSERTVELAKSISLLNATLDSTTDGIVAVQYTGEVVCYNSQFADMWGIPSGLLANPTRERLLAFIADQTKDPQEFMRRAIELDCNEDEALDVLELKDGRTFERHVKPQKVDGKRVGLVINLRDVTARKLAESQLAEANDRLMATSRQAGMAEVATSILHNVGNVLNSVSVSAEVVGAKVRQLRIGSLDKLAELLQENADDLASFLTHDPRGKVVPEYLLKLVSQLAEPQQGVFQEIDLLRKNIEHIREIVSMQQTFARGCGVLETLSVGELIEDAIRLNEAAFDRCELHWVREMADVPPIVTDRHKVLQILINLLSNAQFAVSETGPEKRLIVGAKLVGGDRVQISVSDNGVGIPSENLTRIFQRGFTTKKGGHGFGLHSGALAARELGGRLTPCSAGPGQGATFTLELPLEPQLHS